MDLTNLEDIRKFEEKPEVKELRELEKVSVKRPLTNEELKRLIELGEKIF